MKTVTIHPSSILSAVVVVLLLATFAVVAAGHYPVGTVVTAAVGAWGTTVCSVCHSVLLKSGRGDADVSSTARDMGKLLDDARALFGDVAAVRAGAEAPPATFDANLTRVIQAPAGLGQGPGAEGTEGD